MTVSTFTNTGKASDELGGHIVFGHIDGIGKVNLIETEGDSIRYSFEADTQLMKFIAIKGSIAVNGVSLTVNQIFGNIFSVNIEPFARAKFVSLTNLR